MIFDLINTWFWASHIKLNADQNNFIIFLNEKDHAWTQKGQDKMWKINIVNLLCVIIHETSSIKRNIKKGIFLPLVMVIITLYLLNNHWISQLKTSSGKTRIR